MSYWSQGEGGSFRELQKEANPNLATGPGPTTMRSDFRLADIEQDISYQELLKRVVCMYKPLI